MHRAGLHHRAARGGEPPEAAAAVLLARRSGAARLRGVVAARRLQRPQDAGDAVGVGARVQGAQAGLVEVHPGAQVVQAPAVEQHAGVDRLAALDPRHDADHGVLERVPRHGDRLQICRAGRADPAPEWSRAGRCVIASRSGGNHASRAARRASRRVT